MLRAFAIAAFIVVSLSGCALLGPRPPNPATLDQELLDRQLLDAAHSIQRTQTELRSLAMVSRAPDAAVPTHPSLAGDAGQAPMTIDWQGDASELVHMLATAVGLNFSTQGPALPLPVTVNAKHEPVNAILKQVTAQLDYRATIVNQNGALILKYTPSAGVIR